MIRTLIKKEITETILDLRFWVVTALFLILIPLGMYVSREDYEQRLADYQREHRIYRDNYAGQVRPNVEAQGFRPPSPLSVFAAGIAHFLPDRVITSRSGMVRAAKDPAVDNPQALLMGKVDLHFIVTYVVSLAALLFTFNCISREREDGTLRLIIATDLPRAYVPMAKLIGAYTALLIPLTVALIVALLVLNASPVIDITSGQILPGMVLIILFMALFVMILVSVGVCISVATRFSRTSMVVMLLCWVVLVLAIPKISPMVAQAVHPVESENVMEMRMRVASEAIDEELGLKNSELLAECRRAMGLTGIITYGDPEEKKAMDEFEERIVPIRQASEKRKADQIRQIRQAYQNKRDMQASIAVCLSRLSPVSCLSYLISGLSHTGLDELPRFWDNADNYQQNIKQAIYDKIILTDYGDFVTKKYVGGFDMDAAVLPDMLYRYGTLSNSLRSGIWDIVLLCVFPVVFSAIAFIKFNRYDVR